MTVPALDIANISIVTWWRPSTSLVLENCLGVLSQIDVLDDEYVDGKIKVFPTMELGYPYSTDGHWNNGPYVEVYVRVRVDGYIIAWLPLNDSIAKLILWRYNHNDLTIANVPYNDMTTLAKAIQLIRYETNNHVDDFVHSSVKYWSYQFSSTGYIFLFGLISGIAEREFKVPATTNVYAIHGSWGPRSADPDDSVFWLNDDYDITAVYNEQVSVVAVNDTDNLAFYPVKNGSEVDHVYRYTLHLVTESVSRVGNYEVQVQDGTAGGNIVGTPTNVYNVTKSHAYVVSSTSGRNIILVNDGVPIDAGDSVTVDEYFFKRYITKGTHYSLRNSDGLFKLLNLGEWSSWASSTEYWVEEYWYFNCILDTHVAGDLHGYDWGKGCVSSLHHDNTTETLGTYGVSKFAGCLLTDSTSVDLLSGTGYFIVTFGGNNYLTMQYDSVIEGAVSLTPQAIPEVFVTHHDDFNILSHTNGGFQSTLDSDVPASLITLTYQTLDDNCVGLGDFLFKYTLLNNAPVSLVTLTYQSLDDNVVGIGDFLFKYVMDPGVPSTLVTLTSQSLDDNCVGLGDFLFRYVLNNGVPASLVTLVAQVLDNNIVGLGDFVFKYTFRHTIPDDSIITNQNDFVLAQVGNELFPIAVVGDRTKEGKEITGGSNYLFIDVGTEKAIVRVGDPLSGGGTVNPINVCDFLYDDVTKIALVNTTPFGQVTLLPQTLDASIIGLGDFVFKYTMLNNVPASLVMLTSQALSMFYSDRIQWETGTPTQIDLNTKDGNVLIAKSNGTYYTYGELEMPSFDSLEAIPGWTKITWSSITPSGTLVKFQLNFSDNNVDWSGWGATSGGVFVLDAWFMTSNSVIVVPSFGPGSSGGRYIKVRCRLETTDTTKTPELEWILCKNL